MAMSPAAHTTGQDQIYQNFIAGEWRGSPSGKTFSSTNPANTNEVVGHFQQSTLADLEEAVAAARKAQPAWAAVPAPVQHCHPSGAEERRVAVGSRGGRPWLTTAAPAGLKPSSLMLRPHPFSQDANFWRNFATFGATIA